MSSLPDAQIMNDVRDPAFSESTRLSDNRPCFTEFSAFGLILGTIGFAALLWVAIFAVL